MKNENPRDAARDALKQARNASRKGDLASAERWSKTAERMADAATKLAALPPPENSPERAHALRNELYQRLKRLADADENVKLWRAEYDAWVEAAALAKSEGREAPPEPPLHPAGPAMDPRWNDVMKSDFGIDV